MSRVASAVLIASALLLTACGRGGPRAPGRAALAPSGAVNAAGEPNWSAQLRGATLHLSTAEGVDLTAKVSVEDHGRDGATWSGPLATPGQPPSTLRLAISAKPCRDDPTGMSYAFSATVEAGGKRYIGCAAPPGQGLGPRT